MSVAGREHWEEVYERKPPTELSWYEPDPSRSLALVSGLGLRADAPILDAGGGASGLASGLIDAGFTDVTVADISVTALERARRGTNEPDAVTWAVADLRDHDFGRRFSVWHDRAVFHFMVEEGDRAGYRRTLERSLERGGHAIIAGFGPAGPETCSGLPVTRHDAASLGAALGGDFSLVSSELVDHRTPGGASQEFLWAVLRRR